MILHWDQLVLHYGREVSFHRSKIEAARTDHVCPLMLPILP